MADKEFRAKWLEALRGHQYEQGRNYLHSADRHCNERFCCLGVACDLYVKEQPDLLEVREDNTDEDLAIFFYTDIINAEVADEGLPTVVQKALGLKDVLGGFDANKTEASFRSLAEMNDTGKFSFKDIANFIESNPEGLFNVD